MKSHHLLTISDVCIAVSWDEFFAIQELDSSKSSDFTLAPAIVDQDIGATISMSSMDSPPLPKHKIIDNGKFWRLYTDGKDFLDCRFYADHPETPVWWASIDQQFRNINIGVNIQASHPAADGNIVVGRPEQFATDMNLWIPILLNHEALVFHAAGGIFQQMGIVLPGSSGTGKSTLTNQLIKGGHHMLSDERMIVKKATGGWYAHGTPWPGEAGIIEDGSAPLAAMIFLKQAETNHLRRLSAGEGIKRLLSVCSIPWHLPYFSDKALAISADLVAETPMYELACTPDHHPVEEIERLADSF
jgi:hypothetical protein